MEDILQKLDFKPKEAKVYMACLELGQDTAFNITKKCGLKRSTVYVILEELINKKLIIVNQTQNVTYYLPTNPRILLDDIRNKEKLLENHIMTLEGIYNQRTSKPAIKIFEGKDNITGFYNELGAYARIKGNEVLVFGSTLENEIIYNKSYNSWLKSINSRKCFIREILNIGSNNHEYLKIIKKNNNQNHVVRFLPKQYNFCANDNIIYGNRLAIFSIRDFFVIVIENEKIATTYKSLFKLAWEKAKSIDKKKL